VAQVKICHNAPSIDAPWATASFHGKTKVLSYAAAFKSNALPADLAAVPAQKPRSK
jgi:hypothetical protein